MYEKFTEIFGRYLGVKLIKERKLTVMPTLEGQPANKITDTSWTLAEAIYDYFETLYWGKFKLGQEVYFLDQMEYMTPFHGVFKGVIEVVVSENRRQKSVSRFKSKYNDGEEIRIGYYIYDEANERSEYIKLDKVFGTLEEARNAVKRVDAERLAEFNKIIATHNKAD